MTECAHCKGELRRGLAPFSIDRNGYHLSWDALPAWVCTRCNEPEFEGHVVDAIQDALRHVDRVTASVTTAVADARSSP
jgi:YgiT-type zinc finger domain-containing protein